MTDLLSVLERGEETEHTPPPPEPQNEEFLHREKDFKLHVNKNIKKLKINKTKV